MALDGTLLRQIRHELEGVLIGARIDKIHQISREEMIFILRLPQPHRRRRAQRQAVSFCRSGQPAAAPDRRIL